jgi:hypothetical protein
MAPPWQMPKARRGRPGWIAGNALVTGIICAILAGVISFYVARWQSQDAAKQAVASQQAQELVRVETDATTLYQVAYGVYVSRRECVAGIASACNQTDNNLASSPLLSAEFALGADVTNISDAAARLDEENLQRSMSDALSSAGTSQGYAAWLNMGTAYDRLLTRCGQLIQAR